MKRYTETTDSQMPAYMEIDPNGEYVRYDDTQATITRLTAELTETRERLTLERRKVQGLMDRLTEAPAEVAAAYGRAAEAICSTEVFEHDDDWGKAVTRIRALATEAETTALAEIVKQAVDADRKQFDGYILHKRNCDMMSAFIQGKHCTCGLDAILARIDQRKEAGV